MNRSILIVICDFLLVSLLAFSTVDINKTTSEGVPRQVKTTIATNQVDSRQDLAAVMRLALEQERKGRELLLGELAKTREAAGQQQALLSEREKQVQTFRQELQQKEQQVQTFRQELQQKDQQTTQLEQQQTNLLQQFVAAQTNIQTLSQQLQSSSTEALISKEKLAAMQAELRKQAEQAAALQQQLGQLAQSNQLVLTEKQRLAGQLQVAEAEKRMATEQVDPDAGRGESRARGEGQIGRGSQGARQQVRSISPGNPAEPSAGPEHDLQPVRHQPRPGQLLGCPAPAFSAWSRTSARKPKPCWSRTGPIRSPSVMCRTLR